MVMALWPRLAVWIASALGSDNPVSVFAFIGLLFLALISIQFSMHISRLTTQSKDLAQQVAILDAELQRLIRASNNHDHGGDARVSEDETVAQRADG
jgi:hypothetical protein